MRRINIFIIIMLLILMQAVPVGAAVFSYKNQLTDEEKAIYDNLYDYYFVNKSKGSYTETLDIVSYDETCEMLQQKYVTSVNVAYSALVKDHPEYYWAKQIKITYDGSNYYNNGVFSYAQFDSAVINISGTTAHGSKSIKKFNKAVKKAIKKINKYAGKNPGRVKLIKAINKWIGENTEYDFEHAESSAPKYEYLHNAYGVFIKKSAVCDGYVAAFKILCDYYKIPCVINLGYAYGNDGKLGSHAWNFVRVKKRWYIVDSTWNDTNNSDKWLLCGRKTIKSTHKNGKKRLDTMEIGYFNLPTVSKKSYKK